MRYFYHSLKIRYENVSHQHNIRSFDPSILLDMNNSSFSSNNSPWSKLHRFDKDLDSMRHRL